VIDRLASEFGMDEMLFGDGGSFELLSAAGRRRVFRVAKGYTDLAKGGGIMRIRLLLIASLSICFLSPAYAQEQNQPAVIRANDGGYDGPLQSIFVPPKAGAPFSLSLATEWTRPLGNGGTFTLTNQRRIVRDASGRIYQERWLLVPKGGDIKSHMNVFQITDPEMHTWYNCDTATKVCELLKYRLTSDDTYLPATGTSGPLPNGLGTQVHEDLGASSTEGVETHGYRETVSINPGKMGNDKPMVTVREFWWSQELALNLVSLVDSPRFGRQEFRVKEITTAPPEPSLFVVPHDYKIVDRRGDNN